ncbi:MAG TPA: Glu/Leu/Phe/Val dehydrogenase [Bacteroidota bacterium]|nr:Glu/Leu/Phe/Val dehydrogenase [Bacteroidota bacterium]
MNIFDEIDHREHEQVVFCSDGKVGLRTIVAIHNTTLGPALGGARMWMYAGDQDALRDALRLSRGMTYKASIAGLNLGGGKAVILGNPDTDKSEALFRTYGRFIDTLGGRYITAEDVGTDVRDMEWVRMETKHVTGISRSLGGSGDPSPVTALGVYVGIKATAREVFGSDSLAGKKIAVQGAGKVASSLCEHLAKEGSKLYISDINEERAKTLARRFKATLVKPEKIYDVSADIFAPCALGGILNDNTIPRLSCAIIAGAANNQLLDENKHNRMLAEKEILYAPDYAINAGGLINVANELEGYSEKRALKQAEGIYEILRQIYKIAKADNVPTSVAADKLAENRIHSIGRIKQIFSGPTNGTVKNAESAHKHR